jgi:putative DNA primase/helicase
MDLGFVAIGRPSAKGGMEFLKEMPLAGAEIWIIGENDAGVGKEGMEKTFANLRYLSHNIRYVLPPNGVKDLRQWVRSGLTQEILIDYMERKGRSGPSDVLPGNLPQDIADQFIKDVYTDDEGRQLLRRHYEQWRAWKKGEYVVVDKYPFRGKLYEFLRNKRIEVKSKAGISYDRYPANQKRVNEVIDALNCQCPFNQEPPVWISGEGKQDVSKLIAFKNGLLDIDRFCEGDTDLLPLDPDLFVFATFPYDYDPTSWSDLFDEYCNTTFNGDEDSIRLLAQWLGYVCVPDMSMEKLMILLGPTRAGKGTIVNAMTAMLGKPQCMATSYQQLAEKFGMKPLVGKLAAILGETRQQRDRTVNQTLEVLLKVVGQDDVPVRAMHQVAYLASLVCRFTIGCNELPSFTDHSQALVARSNVLVFPNSYDGCEDYALKGRITEEAKQGRLINFALWGLKDLKLSGRFTVPEASTKVITQFKELTAPMKAFIGDCCIVSPIGTEPRDKMWTAWRGWCDDNGRSPGAKQNFNSWLKQFEPTVELVREIVDGDREYTFTGIRLQPHALIDYLGAPG